ncbi:MAG: hypothetical protein V3S01_11270 [Dehalococcoidia bacterium]
MFMAIIGLLAPFLGDIIGMGKATLDHKFEKEMMIIRLNHAANEHEWRMQEVELQAQTAEFLSARRPHESYGVKLLQAADKADSKVWGWSFNLIFIAFSFLDWLISSVRPVITYWAFSLYAVVKMAVLFSTYQSVERFSTGLLDAISKTALNEATWTTFDADMLMLVIGFWFGNRIRAGRSNAKQS